MSKKIIGWVFILVSVLLILSPLLELLTGVILLPVSFLNEKTIIIFPPLLFVFGIFLVSKSSNVSKRFDYTNVLGVLFLTILIFGVILALMIEMASGIRGSW